MIRLFTIFTLASSLLSLTTMLSNVNAQHWQCRQGTGVSMRRSVRRVLCRKSIPPQPLPQLVGIEEERLTPDGKWMPIAEDEVVMWDDDTFRYSLLLKPNDYTQVASVRFLKRPWDDKNAHWTEFARPNVGEIHARGDLGPGHWAISVEVLFCNGVVLRLHDPDE